jgi:hypothetical protein
MMSIRRRTWLIPIAAGALTSVALMIPATAVSTDAATTLTFTATADAYVSEATPTTAGGTTDRTSCFVNDDTGTRRECLVSFTVTGLVAGDTVTGATVLLDDKGDATGTKLVNLGTVAATWSESTVTWGSRPTLGATVASQSQHTFGQDSSFALAPGTVTANGAVAFALWSPPNSYATAMNFQTKDNTVGKPAPRLVLTVTHQVPPAARFPGDPGVGKILLGLNDVSGYLGVESHMPLPLGLHRVYNGTTWGVPKAAITTAIANHELPHASWKLDPFTVSTVPQSAINTVCTDLKSFTPHPIWATIYHEPEEDLATASDAAAYRALFRTTVHTCDAMGVTNVAWTEPTFQAPRTFGTAAGRNPAWWEPDWKGTSTGTAADWFTGTDRVIDILAIDSYIPLINSNDWQLLSTTLTTVKNRWTALGMPIAGRPWAIGEAGIKSDKVTMDLTKGPNAMQDAYDTALANNFVGISWWTTGGDSFCDGPVRDSDPGCLREQKLAQLDADPRTAHP